MFVCKIFDAVYKILARLNNNDELKKYFWQPFSNTLLAKFYFYIIENSINFSLRKSCFEEIFQISLKR